MIKFIIVCNNIIFTCYSFSWHIFYLYFFQIRGLTQLGHRPDSVNDNWQPIKLAVKRQGSLLMMANESSTALEDHEDQVRPAKMAHFDQVANGYSFEAHTWPLPRRKQVIAYNFNLEHFFFYVRSLSIDPHSSGWNDNFLIGYYFDIIIMVLVN